MDGQKLTKLFRRWWPLLLLLATLLLRLPSLFEPFTYGDEGVYLTLGQAFRRGQVFYRDIHDNKPPLLYLLAAASGSFIIFRRLLLFWSLLTIFTFMKLSELLFGKNNPGVPVTTGIFALLTSLHTLEGNVANAENFMMLPTLAGFYLLAEIQQTKNPVKGWSVWLAIGSLLALSTLFKIPAGFDFVSLLLLYLVTASQFNLKFFKRGLLLNLGFALPILLTFVYYANQHALASYWNAAFGQNIPYLSSWQANQPATAGLPTSLLFKAGFLIAIFALTFWQRRKLGFPTKLVILWFGWTLFAALLSGRPYPHYLLQVIPPLALSFGLIFAKSHWEKLLPAALTAGLAVSFITTKFWHYPNWSYYRNFYQFALGAKTQTAYWLEFDQQSLAIYDLAKYLHTRTNPADRLFIWGNQPSIYALAGRLPVGRFTTAYHIQDFDKSGATLKQLKTSLPRFIVKDANLAYPELEAILQINYAFDCQFGPFLVYHRVFTG